MPDGFSADEIFSWVKAQTAFGPRRPGSPAGKANEDFLFAKLQEFGLANVRREEVPVTHWEAHATSFVAADKELECFGIPYTAFTSEAGIDAPLAWADPKSLFPRESWRGKIVVTEICFPALNPKLLKKISLGEWDPNGDLMEMDHPATWVRLGWHLYHWAAKRGAVGFVGILKDQPGGTCRMYAPYGFKEKDILDKPIPGVWVGRGTGPQLKKLAQQGRNATLILHGTHRPAMSHNIVGEIPGRGNEVIVLSSHHDSPFTSAVEDASGVSVVLALARYLNSTPKHERTIVVLFTAGHFYGSVGTRSFIEKHKSDLLPRTVLEISIEHIALEAQETADGHLAASGRAEPAGVFIPFSKCVRDTVLQGLHISEARRAILLPAEGPLGSYPPTDGGDWYEVGVPVINYISNPVYLLTDDDALRWVDKEALSRVATLFANIIDALDGMARDRITRIDFPLHRYCMKGLQRLTAAKTTWLGLRR